MLQYRNTGPFADSAGSFSCTPHRIHSVIQAARAPACPIRSLPLSPKRKRAATPLFPALDPTQLPTLFIEPPQASASCWRLAGAFPRSERHSQGKCPTH
eukprot:3115445-Pleurochrysis_carterae.AAC.2